VYEFTVTCWRYGVLADLHSNLSCMKLSVKGLITVKPCRQEIDAASTGNRIPLLRGPEVISAASVCAGSVVLRSVYP